ncbi:MAG: response regulator [Lachnospiraceae bacterium]|nr:response regulator [Lachnospiraceae bacterium]
MISLLIGGLLFVEMLVAVSQAITFQVRVKDDLAIIRQIIISGAFFIQCISYIAMLILRDDVVLYVLYFIYWYAGVMMIANLVKMAAYSLDYHGRFLRYIISVIYYLGLVIYFADTFLSKGELTHTSFGVSYPMRSNAQIILYAVFDVIFLAALCYIYFYSLGKEQKKREKHLLNLWLRTFAFSAIGVALEFFCLLFLGFFFPAMLLFCIATIVQLPGLLIYHRRIVIREEDYREVLRSNDTDIVLVCDDAYRIVYMNKRAEIVGAVMKEDFRGQRIPDILLMSPETEEMLYANAMNGVYSIEATYAALNRKVSLNIRPIYDKYHELFSSVITLCGLKDQEPDTSPVNEHSQSAQTQDGAESEFRIARGARLLLINENAIRINVFEKMLLPYSATVTRATNVPTAIREAAQHTFDMIFIDENVSGISAFELAQEIRGMPDPYYLEVPIVYCTDSSMDDQYKEFLEAGFNDYLLKPVSAKHLNHVLTRWLWKRYSKSTAELIAPDLGTKELEMLLFDCDHYYEKREKLLLANCLRAVRQQCVILDMPEFEGDARELLRDILLDESAAFDRQYRSFALSCRSRIERLAHGQA